MSYKNKRNISRKPVLGGWNHKKRRDTVIATLSQKLFSIDKHKDSENIEQNSSTLFILPVIDILLNECIDQHIWINYYSCILIPMNDGTLHDLNQPSGEELLKVKTISDCSSEEAESIDNIFGPLIDAIILKDKICLCNLINIFRKKSWLLIVCSFLNFDVPGYQKCLSIVIINSDSNFITLNVCFEITPFAAIDLAPCLAKISKLISQSNTNDTSDGEAQGIILNFSCSIFSNDQLPNLNIFRDNGFHEYSFMKENNQHSKSFLNNIDNDFTSFKKCDRDRLQDGFKNFYLTIQLKIKIQNNDFSSFGPIQSNILPHLCILSSKITYDTQESNTK